MACGPACESLTMGAKRLDQAGVYPSVREIDPTLVARIAGATALTPRGSAGFGSTATTWRTSPQRSDGLCGWG